MRATLLLTFDCNTQLYEVRTIADREGHPLCFGLPGGGTPSACGSLVADSENRAQPFRHDGGQRSEMIAISRGHPVGKDLLSVS